ncbi:MAG: polyhydroxyalkanoic acid system family protein [Deltaproteobacteria bacterium]|nr:polyhydroxyalkanoic acid system family protein [Deltaproteobacteria bacterium]
MKIDANHAFTVEEAQARIKALTDYWAKRYGVQTLWNGSTAQISGKVRGVSFNGQIAVDAQSVRADVKAGFLAEKLGGRSYVDGKLRDYLNPGHTVEQLQARVAAA